METFLLRFRPRILFVLIIPFLISDNESFFCLGRADSTPLIKLFSFIHSSNIDFAGFYRSVMCAAVAGETRQRRERVDARGSLKRFVELWMEGPGKGCVGRLSRFVLFAVACGQRDTRNNFLSHQLMGMSDTRGCVVECFFRLLSLR
jgi:hypothetical protein